MSVNATVNGGVPELIFTVNNAEGVSVTVMYEDFDVVFVTVAFPEIEALRFTV